MKERPILFSGAMVRAILEGRKMQTRRRIRPDILEARGEPDTWDPGPPGVWRAFDHMQNQMVAFHSGYGQPGDRLWVRETWRTAKSLDDLSPAQIAKRALDADYRRPWAPVEYVATGDRENWDSIWGEAGKTRVSIHMPRWASRLTLELTAVHVDRGPVSEEDAFAEGVERAQGDLFGVTGVVPFEHHYPQDAYTALFEHINGPGSIDLWRWAISFRRLP